MQERDGQRLEVGLLRPLEWLNERDVGERLQLDLAEMGAEGEFQIIAVEACPEIEGGPGRIVTGIFRHSVGFAYNLWLEGWDEPIGVTELHPFWSVDREAWVAACELLVGERLLERDGIASVASLTERDPEPVYNLEVDADHCYRVGDRGVLVHNASCPNEILAGKPNCALFPEAFTGVVSFGLDTMGRAKGVRARLCKRDLGVGSAPSNKPGDSPKGWDEAGKTLLNRGDILVRAHLLHEDLGGQGYASNLVVVCKTVNSRLYHSFEKLLIAWINEGSTVDFEIMVEYSGNSPYPRAIKVHAKRLNCPDSVRTGSPECDELRPGGAGGITATTDITTCNGAILR